MANFSSARPESLSRVESEAGIIATLVHHPEYIYYSESLMPEHFTNEQNKILFGAIKGMAEQDIKQIDAYGILEYIQNNDPKNADKLTPEGLEEFITLSNGICRNSPKEYKIIVSNVWDIAFRRDMLKKLDDCKAMLLDIDSEDVRKKVYEIVDGVTTEYSYGDDIVLYTDRIDELWRSIEERQKEGYSGIPFKFPLLNEYVTIETGELVIFGAQQKVGKSIMLLNCAVDLLRRGKSVLYIDSELSDRLFTARMIAHISGITYRDVTNGNYDSAGAEKIKIASEWLKAQKFHHVYMPFFDAENIYTLVKQVNHRQPIDILIVDYFKSTGNELDAFQTYATMGKVVDTVKNEIAGAMNIAAIGAAQATSQNRLADSAKIARNASTIVMLIDKTPEEIEEDGAECGNKKMIVSVNRNGMQHSQGEWIDLKFDGNHILYEQADKQHIPKDPF